jgi:hypothetical protein
MSTTNYVNELERQLHGHTVTYVTLRLFNTIRVNRPKHLQRYRYITLSFYAHLVQCAYMKVNYEIDGRFETQIIFYISILVGISIYYQMLFIQ